MPDSQRTLLLSFAHPDDESFLAAGTVAKLVEEGGTRVILVTATRGEAATLKPDSPYAGLDLAEARAAELRRAAAILGIEEVIQLGHADGQLGQTDAGRILRDLVSVIRRVRPEVVMSFDPNGENFHRDHIAISRFTSDAIAAAADRRWLPESGAIHRVPRLVWTPPTPIWSMLRDSTRPLESWPGVDFVVDTSGYVARKREALEAHLSQRPGIDALLLGRGDSDRIFSAEAFRLAWGGDLGGRISDDLFEGLTLGIVR